MLFSIAHFDETLKQLNEFHFSLTKLNQNPDQILGSDKLKY